jgi:hypothetical protein
MNIIAFVCLWTAHFCHSVLSYSSCRRSFLVGGGAAAASVMTFTTASSLPVFALDMDAFMNSELQESNTKKPTLTADQGLCQYGAPSRETGEACVRANMSTKRTNSLDAFGTVDRGDFIRCHTYYDDKGDRYEKRVVCE